MLFMMRIQESTPRKDLIGLHYPMGMSGGKKMTSLGSEVGWLIKYVF